MLIASVIATGASGLSSCTGEDRTAEVAETVRIPDPPTDEMEPRVAERFRVTRRAVLRDRDSAEAWATFAMVCDIHGFPEEAIVGYRHAARLDPGDFRWPYFLGMMLDKRGVDPEEIVQAFEKAGELRSDYAPLYVRLGDALGRLGEHGQARESYERAVELDPQFAMAYRRLGEVQLQQRETGAALESLLRAKELTPDDAAVYVALGQAYMRNGEAEKASEASDAARGLERVIHVPDPVRGHVSALGITGDICYQRASLLMDERKYAEAIANLKVKEELSPDDADVHLRLGTCYLQTDQPREAERHFTEVLKLDPDRAQAYLGLGIVSMSAGEVARAERHLRRSLELDDTQASAYARLAVVLAQQGKLNEALGSFEAASELGPLDARAHYNWGRMLVELNRVEEAVGRLEKAVEQYPAYTDAHFLLGGALEALDRRQEAIEHYRKVLELQPRHRGAIQRLHALASQADG